MYAYVCVCDMCVCMYVCSLSRDRVLHPETQWLGLMDLWHFKKMEYHTLCLLGA